MKLLRTAAFVCSVAFSAVVSAADAGASAVIERAREFIGGDKVLNRVTSLKLVGDLEVVQDGIKVKPEERTRKSKIEFIFQKPTSQRITRDDGVNREIIGLADYDGWTRVEPIANPGKWRMAMHDVQKIRRLQASTFDSLNFFSGIESRGGRVESRGETKIDGRDAVNLAFIHPGDVVFTRSFDKKTGQLLQTVTEDGEQVREEGEQRVEGIRFPQRLVSVVTRGEVVITATITFTEIRVNEKFDPAIFEMPNPNTK